MPADTHLSAAYHSRIQQVDIKINLMHSNCSTIRAGAKRSICSLWKLDIGLGNKFIRCTEAPENGGGSNQDISHVEICNASTCGLQVRDATNPFRHESFGKPRLEVTSLGHPILPRCPERCPSWLVADLSAPQRPQGDIAMIFWVPCQLQPCRSVKSVYRRGTKGSPSDDTSTATPNREADRTRLVGWRVPEVVRLLLNADRLSPVNRSIPMPFDRGIPCSA